MWGKSVNVSSIDASAITSGILDAARVPNLDASKIVSGVMAKARIDTVNQWLASEIPNLDVAKITSGVFDLARLPASVKRLVGLAMKPTDTTKNNDAVLADDPHLVVAIEANKSYVVFGFLTYTSPAAADLLTDFNHPAGSVDNRRTSGNMTSAGGASSALAGDITHGTTDGTRHGLAMAGMIINGANAGNIAVRWAQAVATVGDTIMHSGSWLMVFEV